MKLNTQHHLRSMAGYTLDQTILIVAVIAILVTIIIGSMGWELLSRAGGTKLGTHLRQIEAANGDFYSKYSMWPHEAAIDNGMLVLLGQDTALDSQALTLGDNEKLKNYLPSYEVADNMVVSPFGRGGEITMGVETMGGQDYLVITFTKVPSAEAESADVAIDGKAGASGTPETTGRVQYAPEQDASTVTLEFYANVLN